jgi:hypothetical protein
MSIRSSTTKAAYTQRVDFAQFFLQRFELRSGAASFSCQRNKLASNGHEPLVYRLELLGEHRKVVLQSAENGFYVGDER